MKDVIIRLMKNGKTIFTAWIIIISVLIAGGYILGFSALKDYEEDFNRQAELNTDRFEEIGNNLKELSVALENTLDENKIERKGLLSEIEKIRANIEEWKKGYETIISELKGTIEDLKIDRLKLMVENLQEDMNEFKMTVQDLDLKIDEIKGGASATNKEDAISIDLGKISVKKGERRKR